MVACNNFRLVCKIVCQQGYDGSSLGTSVTDHRTYFLLKTWMPLYWQIRRILRLVVGEFGIICFSHAKPFLFLQNHFLDFKSEELYKCQKSTVTRTKGNTLQILFRKHVYLSINFLFLFKQNLGNDKGTKSRQ